MIKNDKIRFLLCALFFIFLAAVTFRCAWPADHVFSASDLNIGRLAFKKHHLPESLTGYFTANQVMGASGSHFILFNVLLAILPLKIFANTFYGLVLVFGSCSMIWLLRMWGRGWLASVFGALIAFWFNSITLAAVGHAYKMEVLAFSVLSLCLIEKAIRCKKNQRAVGYSFLTGLSVGIMMLEQQDVALLAGFFVGAYTFFRLIQLHRKSALRWVAILLPIAFISLALSGRTVLKSYERNIKGAAAVQGRGDGNDKWNYITQWSMVPQEWPDLIAFGWSGWSSNNPEGPYWGKIGQSAEWEAEKKGFQNFKLNSVYFGVIPFLIGLYGMFCAVRNRKCDDAKVMIFWSVAGIIGFMLAFGKYSLLYKLFYQLPMVGNIRAPMKFMDNFQICLGIVSAYGLDQLIECGRQKKSSKILWIISGICGALMLIAGIKVAVAPGAWASTFSNMGYGSYVDIMTSNMSQAWLHAAVLALVCTGLVFVVWKGFSWAKWVAVAFIIVLSSDSVIQTSRYFKANDISSIEKGNVLINYLKQNQGNERTFFMDQSGIYNQWLASDGPYHGLNLFNIWQMPRMPVEYKEYLGKVGQNQIRLWQLSAIKYVAAPSAIMQQLQQNPELGKQFKPVLNYQVPTAQGMRNDVLLEFIGGIPRFALFENWKSIPVEKHCDKLVEREHNPLTTVLVGSSAELTENPGNSFYKPVKAEVTKRKATIYVHATAPSILRFSQRYQAKWKVLVDGKPAQLLRIDYLSMGVQVQPGKHVVEFRCVTGTPRIVLMASVFVAALGVSALLLLWRRREAGS